MKILIVNKFLFYNGGSETYIFELGRQLMEMGHEVQYFGMDHPDRVVGNEVSAYTTNMDFHNGSIFSQLLAPFNIIYSRDARCQIRKVLDAFQPDVVHLNNINFQITPSIFYEIRAWEKYQLQKKQRSEKVKILATIHDPQWVCPNHTLINGKTGEGCSKCLKGHFGSCTKDKCIHSSTIRSLIGTIEATLYRRLHTYREVDRVIVPSNFMEQTMRHNPDIADNVIMLRNFLNASKPLLQDIEAYKKKLFEDDRRYVLYFGRYSEEKGIRTLIRATKELKDIQFVFAGNGPYESEVNQIDNIKNMGFVTGNDLMCLIAGADISLIASECYENCPFSVMESIVCGTPVIGSNIGGIPELIKTEGEEDNKPNGMLFEAGNVGDLVEKINSLYSDKPRIDYYSANCSGDDFYSISDYTSRMIEIINGVN